MKAVGKISIKRETVSKFQNFDWATVKGGVAEKTPPFTPPKISVATFTCSVCDNA